MADMKDGYDERIIKPGDRASQIAFEVNVGSYQNCPAIEVLPDMDGDWRGDVGTVWRPHVLDCMKERTETGRGSWRPTMWETHSTDGAGHKPQFSAADDSEESFSWLGVEPIIMNDHDILRRGGKPCFMTSFADIKSITERNIHLLEAFWRGYAGGLREAGLANITGETAVVPWAVTAFCDLRSDAQLIMNLAGNCTGLHHIDKYIDGKDVKSDMPIVGFWEKGLRCNGSTSLIDIAKAVFGPSVGRICADPEALAFFKKAAIRSQSYSKTMLRVVGWEDDGSIKPALARIVAAYHITGGGIWNKLKLPLGIGAVLDDMLPPPEILLWAQELSWGIPELKISDWKAHRTFHGGPGMIFICETEQDAETLIAEASADGISAERIGNTTADPEGEIIIYSKFRERKILSSLRPE